MSIFWIMQIRKGKCVVMIRETELKEDWQIVAIDHVGTRIVYFFESQLFPDVVQVRITVSRIFADSESQAWKILSETVK